MAVTAEQQAAAEKYRKRIAEQDQVREETPTQRGRAFLQGLTFGTADEIEAWLRSANDEEYEQLLNEIRGNLDAYSQARPCEAGIAEIGGAALPALVATVMTGGSALAAVGARLPKLTQLIGKATGKLFGTSGTQTITGGAVVGAGQGAATGFGTGEGGFEERLRGATGGGVIGLGTGAAGQFAGDILAKGVDVFIDW